MFLLFFLNVAFHLSKVEKLTIKKCTIYIDDIFFCVTPLLSVLKRHLIIIIIILRSVFNNSLSSINIKFFQYMSFKHKSDEILFYLRHKKRDMVKTLKFVYDMILFIFLYLVAKNVAGKLFFCTIYIFFIQNILSYFITNIFFLFSLQKVLNAEPLLIVQNLYQASL